MPEYIVTHSAVDFDDDDPSGAPAYMIVSVLDVDRMIRVKMFVHRDLAIPAFNEVTTTIVGINTPVTEESFPALYWTGYEALEIWNGMTGALGANVYGDKDKIREIANFAHRALRAKDNDTNDSEPDSL